MKLRAAPERDRGSVAVIVAFAFVPMSAMLATVADGGLVWWRRQELQNGVEAAVMEAADRHVHGLDACHQSTLALVSVDGVEPSGVECSVAGSATNGVVTVTGQADVALNFAQVIGRDSATIESSASVRIGAATAASGLRPLAMCVGNPALTTWLAGGMTSTDSFRIDINASTPACGGSVPGNWAVIDFDGGANSMSAAQNWIQNGYSGSVSVGQTLDGDPGIPSPALQVNTVVGDTFSVPVFANPRLSGSNSLYDIVGFVRLTLVSATLSGSASQRHLVVRFTTYVSAGSAGPSSQPSFGSTAYSICSFDSQGDCS